MCCILVKIIDYRLECRLLAAAASLLVSEEKKGGEGKKLGFDNEEPWSWCTDCGTLF